MTRAYTLVDVFNQLNQDSAEQIDLNPTEVVNAFLDDTAEVLVFHEQSVTLGHVTDYPRAVIEDAGQVAYWRLDDPVGSTWAFDSNALGAKNPATVNGTVTFGVTGAMNGSTGASFNGTSGYLSVANTAALQITGTLTIEAWINPASLASNMTVVSKGTTGEYEVTVTTTGAVKLAFGTTTVTVCPDGSITAGRWQHLVVTRDPTTMTCTGYLNGVQAGSASYAAAPTATTNAVNIGRSVAGTQYWSGALDEVVIYPVVLSAAQAANHYAWGTAPDVGANVYGTAKYGKAGYPVCGPAGNGIYGTSNWGQFTWG